MAQVNMIYNLTPDQRKSIDRKLVNGTPMAAICREFGVSKNSLANYRDRHLAPQLLSGAVRSSQNHIQSLFNDMGEIMQTSKDILQSALDDNHRSLSLKALKEVRLNIETLAKLFATTGMAEDQIDPVELTRFREWEARQAKSVEDWDLAKLSPQERSIAESMARKRIKQAGDGTYDKGPDEAIIVEEISDPPRRMRRKKK